MTNIFFRIYTFTRAHKTISLFSFFILLFVSLYFASKIRLEENIISVIPKDEGIARVNRAFEGFKMNNRLIVHLYRSRSASENSAQDPQALIQKAHSFSDSLQAQYGNYVEEVKLEFPDTQLETLYSYYYEQLPFYLQEKDYEKIRERSSETGLETTVRQNYKALMSPMSMMTKKMLVRDPLSLVSLPLQRTNKLRLDDNIELYQNHLLTKDLEHLIFFVSLSNPPNETAHNGVLVAGMDQLIEEFENSDPSVQVEYFGSAAVSVANAQRIKHDIYLTVSFAVLALFLFISFFYRRISVFFIAITPGLFGAVLAVALLAILKGKVSAISLGVGSVLLGITIDYSLHFFTHYKHQQDLKKLFSDLTMPLLISSLTTACAFLSLLFLSSDALADLGIFAATSVLTAALYTLLVLPHFIIGRNTKSSEPQQRNVVERMVSSLANYPFHKARWAMGILLLLSLVSIFTWQNYSFESNMLRLNYMPDKLAAYEENLNRVSTYTANNIHLINTGKDLWEALEKSKAVQQKLKSLEQDSLIYGYITVNDIIPERSLQAERLKRWNAYWQQQRTDSFLTGFYQQAGEVGFQPTAFTGFENMLRHEYKLMDEADVEPILALFGDDLIIENGDSVSVISSVKLSALQKQQLLKEFEALPETLIFDKAYFTSRLVELLQEDFNTLVNLSLVVVFFIILLTYGRIELALITFIPILLSWLWILGLMGLFGLKFNIVNIIVCTFIFGLGIDYSIFVMRGLTQNFKYGLNTIISYKKSIILSAVTTLTGIGVLAFAEHPALKSIALLAIIGIMSVIFLTFTIQPIMYDFLILNRKRKGQIPFTIGSLFLSVIAFVYFLLGCVLLMVLLLLVKIPVFNEKKKKHFYHWVMMMFCRTLVYMMANFKKDVVGLDKVDFSKPSVIIANHHSFIDILIMLMFNPKVVMVTNDWVYNSPFFGKAVQYADFILASKGVENQLDKIEELIHEGYSIVIFPEGTRSDDHRLGRFHKGAFYLAEHFKLDIQPVILHGTHYTMAKKDTFYLKNGTVTVKFLPRIAYDDASYGKTYAERAKAISRYFKDEYQQLREQQETAAYFQDTIMKNYLYKGPVLEWYLKIKYRLEKGYVLFHSLVPQNARVIDLGCGYGFMSSSLALSGVGRQVLGVDYDQEKIEVAGNVPVRPDNLRFDHGDVTTYAYGEADVFIVSDVLHYLLPEDQLKLLHNMADKLESGGKIIIRDGDSSKAERHKGTKLTELFSTSIIGFNKTQNALHYISADMIRQFADENNFELSIIDNTKLTSNTVFVLTHKNNNG